MTRQSNSPWPCMGAFCDQTWWHDYYPRPPPLIYHTPYRLTIASYVCVLEGRVSTNHPRLTSTPQISSYVYFTGMPALAEFTNCVLWYLPATGKAGKHYTSWANSSKCSQGLMPPTLQQWITRLQFDFCSAIYLPMVGLRPSSSLSTGCMVSLRGDWAIFCHAGSGRVSRVWSARENALKYFALAASELNPGHGEDRQWDYIMFDYKIHENLNTIVKVPFNYFFGEILYWMAKSDQI